MINIRNNEERILPVLAVDLIDDLDKLYSDKMPDPNVTRDESMYKAGQRSVVDRLLELKRQANQEELEGGMRDV